VIAVKISNSGSWPQEPLSATPGTGHSSRSSQLLKPPPNPQQIVRSDQYHCDDYEAVELSVLCHKKQGDHRTDRSQEFSMSKTAITSPELAPPVGPFSQAVDAGGFIYFSGQVGQDPMTGKLVAGGIAAETDRLFQNLSAVLKAAGKSFDDVVRVGVFLTSMSDYVAVNGTYAKHFRQPFPVRTTIGVAALPLGASVEIDLVVKA